MQKLRHKNDYEKAKVAEKMIMKKIKPILISLLGLLCVGSLATAESNHGKSPVVSSPAADGVERSKPSVGNPSNSLGGVLIAAEPAGAKSPHYQVEPFALGQVKLLPSEFTHARDLNAAYLLQLDPDRLMARTRVMCGLKPKKESYGGWEHKASELGHYISACASIRSHGRSAIQAAGGHYHC